SGPHDDLAGLELIAGGGETHWRGLRRGRSRLREGLEDWEYLYLLREAINKKTPGAAKYSGLLKVPSSISEDMANFCREPQPIYAQRAKLAAALEKLQVDKLGIK
ncbi:MAG: hypothetical protein ACM3VW_02815, partial [Bacteroidota bacterium]